MHVGTPPVLGLPLGRIASRPLERERQLLHVLRHCPVEPVTPGNLRRIRRRRVHNAPQCRDRPRTRFAHGPPVPPDAITVSINRAVTPGGPCDRCQSFRFSHPVRKMPGHPKHLATAASREIHLMQRQSDPKARPSITWKASRLGLRTLTLRSQFQDGVLSSIPREDLQVMVPLWHPGAVCSAGDRAG